MSASPFIEPNQNKRFNRRSFLARSNANRQRRTNESEDDDDDEAQGGGASTSWGKGVTKTDEPAETERLNELKSRIRSLEEKVSELRQYSDLFQLISTPLTARTLLFLQNPSGALVTNPSSKPDTTPDPSGLDTALSVDKAIGFAKWLDSVRDTLGPDSYSIEVCCLCERALYFRIPAVPSSTNPLSHTLPRSEFNCSRTGTLPCSPEPICDDCFLPAIISSITKDWWHNLHSERWIKCPHPDCDDILPGRYHTDLASILSNCRDPSLSNHLRLFNLAAEFRTALKALDPIPTPEALAHAAKFHKDLEKHGRIVIFPPRSTSSPTPPEVKLLPMDTSPNQTIQVPIFTSLLLKPDSNLRECIICTDLLPDLTDGSPLSESTLHSTIVTHFPGDWSNLIRPFPASSSLPACASIHPLNTCLTCLSRTIRSQLETRGRIASQSLICPHPDCGHIYTHSELRSTLDSETFALYDRHRLNLHLSSSEEAPNFRWCLRPACPSGQIHEVVGPGWGLIQSPEFPVASGRLNPNRNKISCGDCGFVMCFEHQIPWHEGLSCLEYDDYYHHHTSQDGGGGGGARAVDETREWLSRNTKQCTCGARVQKAGGCWHMTCQMCGRDFCWSCLADWEGNIMRRNAQTGMREYRVEGHEEGCYFREEGAFRPVVVMGDDLEDAIRVLEGGEEFEWE
ncbi:hypothetical protein QBC44DRAFT_362994 [Cladorrhinum sp. PSN332]|nr:hypothetical protein QBC44DRAFT_362994 [Cladorrhinum sp. PSN332]